MWSHRTTEEVSSSLSQRALGQLDSDQAWASRLGGEGERGMESCGGTERFRDDGMGSQALVHFVDHPPVQSLRFNSHSKEIAKKSVSRQWPTYNALATVQVLCIVSLLARFVLLGIKHRALHRLHKRFPSELHSILQLAF